MAERIVTGNRLRDGIVVYLDDAGGWTERIEAARVAGDAAEGAALLALAERPQERVRVVGPYLIDVVRDGGRPRAASLRERIRARGPSVETGPGRPAAPA